MGTSGAREGIVLLCDRKRRKVSCACRGGPTGRKWDLEEVEKFLYRGFQATQDRRLDPMSVSAIIDPQAVFSESEMNFTVHTAALFTVDDSLLGLAVLGVPLGKSSIGPDELELLRGLTASCMVFLKNARAFETIQALNDDLCRTNADLRQTIVELTEARNQIRLLEVAKSRLKQLIQSEQKHLPDAINIPAALFDILYPMKLGRMLKPEQVVLVYGRTISKRYDEDVAQRLLQRHEHIKVMEGSMRAWEEKGLPVAP